MTSPKVLVIRADANVAMGTGHVFRSLALAEAWKDHGGNVIFTMAQSTPAIEHRLSDEGITLEYSREEAGSDLDAKALIKIAETWSADWVLIDGYHFGGGYQETIKQAGLQSIFVDDAGMCANYFADIVLNHNITASPEMYSARDPDTALLLGTKYVRLRRQFRTWYSWQRKCPAVAKQILVTLGGSDPEGLTLPVITALSEIRENSLEIKVVVGGSNLLIDDLPRSVRELGHVQMLVDVRNMAEIMAQSDLAIICGGGTLWEALYMGCGTLTYSRPGVQDRIIQKLSASGAVVDLGMAGNVSIPSLLEEVQDLVSSSAQRELLSQRGREIVDGGGTERVLKALLEMGTPIMKSVGVG